MPCAATQMANELDSQGMWNAPKATQKHKRDGRIRQHHGYY